MGINLGGGKSVIIGDNKRVDREALFRAHGRFVETLGGRYITAEDIGTSPADMEYIKLETDHVAGLVGLSGDPSPVTAYGVYVGMKATAKARWGSDSLTGKTVAVQGCGNVATHLCRHLHADGVKLIVTDIDPDKVQPGRGGDRRDGGGARTTIYDQAADVYAPCALGAIINDDTLARLKVEIIAGGANNQLAEDRHGDELEQRGILYAPDYVINGGGVINVYGEIHRWPHERSKKKAGEIYDTLLRIFDIASGSGSRPTARPTGWPRSGSRRWADWTGCGWAADGSGRRRESSRFEPLPSLYPRREFLYIRGQMPEVIPIGADHAGVRAEGAAGRGAARARVRAARPGHQRHRVGGLSRTSRTRWPRRVERHDAQRGVLLCGTGLGMSYAANRHPGVRAAVAWTPEVARLAREHNDANVLVLPARFVSEDEGVEILKTWLDDARSPAAGTAAGWPRSTRSRDESRSQRVAAGRRSRRSRASSTGSCAASSTASS